jgi:hypothetical protein
MYIRYRRHGGKTTRILDLSPTEFHAPIALPPYTQISPKQDAEWTEAQVMTWCWRENSLRRPGVKPESSAT